MTASEAAVHPSHEPGELTDLLRAWNDGDRRALEELVSLVYGELKQIASAQLRRERRHHTLQATEMVHEAFLRLARHPVVRWQDRRHFFAAAARTMRRLLVDHARRRNAEKRGGSAPEVGLDEVVEPSLEWSEDLVAFDLALAELYSFDPIKGWIAELRVFGGFSVEGTAEVVGCSRATVVRQWRVARAWLYQALRGGAAPEGRGGSGKKTAGGSGGA